MIFSQLSRITPGQRSCFEDGVEIDHVLAIDAAVFVGHRLFEPAGELFDHHVEARMHGLALFGAAAIEAEHAAPPGQASAIQAPSHADGETGHRTHQVRIIAADGFERQLRQNVPAGVALEHELGDAKEFVSHDAPPRDVPARLRATTRA